jgi:hypothetical protein
MTVFNKSWIFLKDDTDDNIFIEDFGEVPKSDYYDANWWANHPNEEINSMVDDYGGIEYLQSVLDKDEVAGSASQVGAFSEEKYLDDNPRVFQAGQALNQDDPFRMKRPEMDTELEELATEAGRRKGRAAEDYDHQLDFDTDNPQNERLINVIQPQMDRRQTDLEREIKRRSLI